MLSAALHSRRKHAEMPVWCVQQRHPIRLEYERKGWKKAAPWRRQINVRFALRIITSFLAIVYFFSIVKRRSDVQGDHSMPDGQSAAAYATNSTILRSGWEWMGHEAQNAREKVVKKQLLRFKSDTSGLVTPHPRLDVPDFQEQMYQLTASTWKEYERILTNFAESSLSPKLARWSIARLRSKVKEYGRQSPIPMQIWQTGKELPDTFGSFEAMNPSASYNFLDDGMLETFMRDHFYQSAIVKAWQSMERIVLKADLWRYLVMFVEGGFYTDTDTTCLKRVDEWGKTDATVWDTGKFHSDSLALGPPLVVVGIEVDVPDVTGWETFWTRPIQIVQWTMASEPGHPIFLDAMRRVTNSMSVIKEWQNERQSAAQHLMDELFDKTKTIKERKKTLNTPKIWNDIKHLIATDPFDKNEGGIISLIEATGPGAFSDAVFSYLWARFGVHWSQIHDIQVATRIGDVAIVPITGFAPFERPDWPRWKGLMRGPMTTVGDVKHAQALVNHHFSGSWRTEKDNTL